jgi:hypothetical protein
MEVGPEWTGQLGTDLDWDPSTSARGKAAQVLQLMRGCVGALEASMVEPLVLEPPAPAAASAMPGVLPQKVRGDTPAEAQQKAQTQVKRRALAIAGSMDVCGAIGVSAVPGVTEFLQMSADKLPAGLQAGMASMKDGFSKVSVLCNGPASASD